MEKEAHQEPFLPLLLCKIITESQNMILFRCASVLLFLFWASPNLSAQLVFFDGNANLSQDLALYDFDIVTRQTEFRTNINGNAVIFSLAVRPSDSQVFGITNGGDLYGVNIDSGDLSFVGATGVSALANIDFDPITNQLFGVGRNSSALYTIGTADAATSLVGTASSVRAGLVFDDAGVLFGFNTDTENNQLYEVNPSTAESTLIGSTGLAGSFEDATFLDGNLFVADFDGFIYRVNPTTGNGSIVGNTGLGQGLTGLTSVRTSVPEPGCGLLFPILISLHLVRRRRRE